MKVYCGHCIYYQGSEKIKNPKSTAWFDSNRPKCAINKSQYKQSYQCKFFEPLERFKECYNAETKIN